MCGTCIEILSDTIYRNTCVANTCIIHMFYTCNIPKTLHMYYRCSTISPVFTDKYTLYSLFRKPKKDLMANR